jgi:hypothetical protein
VPEVGEWLGLSVNGAGEPLNLIGRRRLLRELSSVSLAELSSTTDGSAVSGRLAAGE